MKKQCCAYPKEGHWINCPNRKKTQVKITDKMRLDWLQKNEYDEYINENVLIFVTEKNTTLRKAIDAAIKSESKLGKA